MDSRLDEPDNSGLLKIDFAQIAQSGT